MSTTKSPAQRSADRWVLARAYNVGMLRAQRDTAEAIYWLRKASELRPSEPKYAYTLAFYVRENGDGDGAVHVLQEMLKRNLANADAYALLGHIHEESGRKRDAIAVYHQAVENERLLPAEHYRFISRIREMENN